MNLKYIVFHTKRFLNIDYALYLRTAVTKEDVNGVICSVHGEMRI
jgi:hypothetical protein